MSDTYLTFSEPNDRRFNSRNGMYLSLICNLLIEMPHLEDAVGDKSYHVMTLVET
jgi:hypothetical protein